MRRLALPILFAGAMWGQVGGPRLGWTPEGGRIRPMYGLPGAGSVGNGVSVGRNLGSIAISPSQDYVLATDADNGAALVVVPGVSVSQIAGAAAGASRMAVSPRGSAAGLWFGSNSHFQVISGLPGSPAVREIDTTFLGAPAGFAVSDDGAWLAGAWKTGVYKFGPDGAVTQVSADNDVEALTFYAGRTDLALASATQIVSIINGAAAVVYQDQAPAPGPRRTLHGVIGVAGIATSFDNRWLVRASRTGRVVTVDTSSGAAAVADCGCAAEGVFGLDGAVFRLTSGDVKVFDAAAGVVSIVPPANGPGTATPAAVTAAISQIPPMTIGGLPASPGYKQQPGITVSLAAPFTDTLTGTLTLTFASSVGGDDQMILFANSTGGRTVIFTIPAGSTQASFAGSPSSCNGSNTTLCVPVQTGTVAGKITLTVTSVIDSGTDVTPNPQPTASFATNPTVPFVQTVAFSQITGGLSVKVNGFSSSRDMVSGLFHFAPAQNATVQGDVTVPLSSAFTTWYQSTTSNQYGSQFTLTVPFTVQGNPAEIVAVTVTLTNSKGASTPVSPQ